MARDPRQRSLFEDLEPPERGRRTRPARTALAVPARCEVPAGLVLRLADRDADLHRFVRALDRRLPKPLDRVTLTDNRSRFLSARPSRGRLFGRSRLALRLHWGFALAPGTVLGEVAAFLGERGERRRQALETLRDYFEEFQEPGARQRSRRGVVLDPHGEHHDLNALRDQVNQRYFGGRLEVPITWGREPGRRRQRTIHLGTYDFERNLIRIHRRLDHPKVPRLVVASVVHHELLHAAMPAETVRGRRRLHPPEFRRGEQAFARHREAQEWIRANLPWLLRATGPR